MTAGVIFDLLWRWRFTVLLAVLGIVLYGGYNLITWKNSQIDAERTRANLSTDRAEASDKVIDRRTARDAEREKENAALRHRITEILRRDPAAAAWGATPLPAAVIGLLQADTAPLGPAQTDASTDLDGSE